MIKLSHQREKIHTNSPRSRLTNEIVLPNRNSVPQTADTLQISPVLQIAKIVTKVSIHFRISIHHIVEISYNFRHFLDKGEPLQVFSLLSEIVDGEVVHKLELNENNLKKILLHPEVKDRPVAIVSVAGALRKGKSFLLDFLLKYLEAHERPAGVCKCLST